MPELRTVDSSLKGWKSIAGYFGRDERTVMRWANQRGMPIRRLPGAQRSSVYALPEELAAWFAGQRTGAAEGDVEAIVEGPAGVSEGSDVPAALPLEEAAPSPASAATLPVRANAPSRWWAAGAILLLLVAVIVLFRPGSSSLRAHRPVSTDPNSTRLFLQASYDLANRTPASLRRAVAEFGSSIAADPRNAAAYAGLGEAYLLLPEFSTAPSADCYRRAEAAADAAIALDPAIASAHRVRAFVDFWADGDVPRARDEFKQALALAPDDAVTHHWFATALSANGEEVAAVSEIQRAQALDPQSTSIMADSGLLLYLAGHEAEGLATLRHVEDSRPDQISAHRYLADLGLVRGDTATFLREGSTAARLRGDPALSELVAVARAGFAQGGRAAMLVALDQLFARRVARTGAGWYQLARVAALRGQGDRAVAMLQRAAAAHDPSLIFLPGDDCLGPIKDLPAVVRLRPRTSLIA